MFDQLGVIGNIAVLVASLAGLIRASSLAITNSVNLASVSGLGKMKLDIFGSQLQPRLKPVTTASSNNLNATNCLGSGT